MTPDTHQSVSRAEREATARQLRDEGLLLREIAERMGVAISTVDAWLNDPGGERLRARKVSYSGVCKDCGGPTSGCNGRSQAPERCDGCMARKDAEEYEAVRTAVVRGEDVRTIASRRGVSPSAIYEALRRHGDGVRTLR